MPSTADFASHLDAVHSAIERLQRLTDLFAARRAQLAERVGLTEQQWHVLEEISTEHFMPSLFARQAESSAAAVSKILRQLLDKRLVKVSVSEDDGRQRQYELTSTGRRTMKTLREFRRRAIEYVWSDLPLAELESFLSLSGKVIARIERYAALESKRTTDLRESERE